MTSIATATVTTDGTLSSSPSDSVVTLSAAAPLAYYKLQDTELSTEVSTDVDQAETILTMQPGVSNMTEIGRKQPRNSSSSSISSAMRRLSGRDKPLPEPVDGDAFFRGQFAEVYTIGGGTYWFLALFLFILEVLVVLKHAGVPGGAQLAALFNAFLEAPLIGPLLKFAMCGSTRHSYKVATAIEEDHPTLKEQRPTLKEGDLWAAPTNHFFPQRFKGHRGTPENLPITDFENAMPGNERGALWDLLFHGSERGFRLRFKTGISKTGGQTVFTVKRTPPQAFCKALCEQLYGLVTRPIKPFTVCCPCCCGTKELESSDEVEVFDSSGNIVGRVRKSTQIGKWEALFRNRFNKKAYPIYDVLGPDGEIIYTLLVPIRQYTFLGCCCTAYEDLDFISIVPGTRDTTGRFGGADAPEMLGWMLRLDPLQHLHQPVLLHDGEVCQVLEHFYFRKSGVLCGVPQGGPNVRHPAPDLPHRQHYTGATPWP
jgi:hypothetical protein